MQASLDKGKEIKGLRSLGGIQAWITPPDKLPRPAKVLTKGEQYLEWVRGEGMCTIKATQTAAVVGTIADFVSLVFSHGLCRYYGRAPSRRDFYNRLDLSEGTGGLE